MNESGDSAGPARGDLRVPLEQVVVVHDEIDLPFGEIRSKLGGGVAGHNGLKSLAAGLRQPDFWRVRVGVGRPDSTDPEIVSAYVLGRFTEPADEVSGLIAEAADEAERPRRPDRRRVESRTTSERVTPVTTLLGRRRRRAAAARSPRGPQRDQHRDARASCSPTCARRATTTRSAPSSISSTDHMGLSAGADVREQLDAGGAACGGCSSSPCSTTSSPGSRSRRSPPATAPASAAAPRSPSAATCGSAARTCACASPAARSGSRSAPRGWSPSAGSRSPSTCC